MTAVDSAGRSRRYREICDCDVTMDYIAISGKRFVLAVEEKRSKVTLARDQCL